MRVILVPVADRPECAIALQTAFNLGERLGASVSGCHVRPHRYSNRTLGTAFADAAWRRRDTKRAPAAAKALYQAIAEQHGYKVSRRARQEPSALWAERVGSPDKLMGIVGPVADLVVVSRPMRAGTVADLFMLAALIESTRPVLIVPSSARKIVGKHVCIAWNQSSDAARCVTAAIPILQQANEVTIVSCGPEDRAGPQSNHLAAYLTQWGVKTTKVSTRGRNVEAELMAACKEKRADVLLGGAYSRSRWREKVFGGTTEFLIRKATIPVMLLHG
ncbi:MAG: universal stress protein [Gammaproteobacteria bacterium]|nr:universal stress protein [Gammaproteobacteria bacterium]MDH3373456.1 universal stress protein [Gammaproteobacteria bacterium]MDH3410457.1 universal stress protein [Gammaproteobacteria bacterium]MDH3551259.1 universal stress protein [Gammaproteobacteria bacterium]